MSSPDCPYCDAGVPETLTHFAYVCPQDCEVRTSAHSQVWQVVPSFHSQCAGPNWKVYEETCIELTLSKVPAAVVTHGVTLASHAQQIACGRFCRGL